MEHINQELEQYLQIFCSKQQDDWDELLLDAEFQYNNHVHSATQTTPFLLDTRHNPCMGFKPRQHPSPNESVNKFMNCMKQAQEKARAALAKAKDNMARYYNQQWTPVPEYQPSDKVYLDAEDIQTTRPSKKLSHKFLGPYVVEHAVGPLAYCLRLPRAMRSIHPVFHVVKLRPAVADLIPG